MPMFYADLMPEVQLKLIHSLTTVPKSQLKLGVQKLL